MYLEDISLNCTASNVFGVSKTVAGGNSTAATVGTGSFQYPASEAPYKACDNSVFTKTLNFGPCNSDSGSVPGCGLETGIYVTSIRSASLATGLQFCTGNDLPERDPTMITLEGSNGTSANLVLGSSWTLIYRGPTGLDIDPDRFGCGTRVSFSNTMAFKSYRMLVTAKRANINCVQYSEFKLLGI